MDADGSGKHHVTRALGQVYGLAWSPDGTRIVLSYADDLAVFNAGGGDLSFVSTGAARVTGFSPPGRRTGGSSSAGAAGIWARSARSGPTAAG